MANFISLAVTCLIAVAYVVPTEATDALRDEAAKMAFGLSHLFETLGLNLSHHTSVFNNKAYERDSRRNFEIHPDGKHYSSPVRHQDESHISNTGLCAWNYRVVTSDSYYPRSIYEAVLDEERSWECADLEDLDRPHECLPIHHIVPVLKVHSNTSHHHRGNAEEFQALMLPITVGYSCSVVTYY